MRPNISYFALLLQETNQTFTLVRYRVLAARGLGLGRPHLPRQHNLLGVEFLQPYSPHQYAIFCFILDFSSFIHLQLVGVLFKELNTK